MHITEREMFFLTYLHKFQKRAVIFVYFFCCLSRILIVCLSLFVYVPLLYYATVDFDMAIAILATLKTLIDIDIDIDIVLHVLLFVF